MILVRLFVFWIFSLLLLQLCLSLYQIQLFIMKKKWRKFNNGFKSKYRKVTNGFKLKYRKIVEGFKAKYRKFIKKFKPKYNVDVTLYHFIPGMPVKSNCSRHFFNKGEFKEAKLFFDKASEKTKHNNVAPVEISLVKGKRRIVISRHFGPVKTLKKLRMSA